MGYSELLRLSPEELLCSAVHVVFDFLEALLGDRAGPIKRGGAVRGRRLHCRFRFGPCLRYMPATWERTTGA